MALIHHPPTIVNKYLGSQLNLEGFDGATYFFPTLPTQIDSLTETFPDSNGVFAVYDRMFKMRRAHFLTLSVSSYYTIFMLLETTQIQKWLSHNN